mmetsp:Transcript_55497/g.104376  ORF Transcript_55497/g.104376 Transcript_55497/m.104376 type:complete len:239 (-) Transcript_55497:51-767(-)
MPSFPRFDEGFNEPDINFDNLAEQALLARLKVSDRAARRTTYTFQEACDHVRWALDMHRYPLGRPPRRYEWIWGHLLCNCGICAITLTILILMLIFTRGWVGSVNVEGGVLFASGKINYGGEEPLAATAAVLEQRDLRDLSGLPADLLQNVRDVVISHAGIWRCLHIARVTKYRDGHAWMEAHDGTGVRLQDGRAFLRFGLLGNEEPLQIEPSDNATSDASEKWEPPMAYFNVFRSVS